MKRYEKSAEQLLVQFEDMREIRNLMGKYTSNILLKRENTIYRDFWSKRDDVCYGENEGYWKGADAVKGYYDAIYRVDDEKAAMMRDMFPNFLGDLSDEEIHGVGTFVIRPISSVIIKIADDRQTAKAIWLIQGMDSDITTSGPMSSWLWAYYTADFVWEDEEWRIWHLQYLEDVHHYCGQDWSKPQEEHVEEGFETAVFEKPVPNVPMKVRERYSPTRPYTPAPRLPEDYRTFSETFSYGI